MKYFTVVLLTDAWLKLHLASSAERHQNSSFGQKSGYKTLSVTCTEINLGHQFIFETVVSGCTFPLAVIVNSSQVLRCIFHCLCVVDPVRFVVLPFELWGGCFFSSCSFTGGCSSAYFVPLASYRKQILLFYIFCLLFLFWGWWGHASETIGHVHTADTRLAILQRLTGCEACLNWELCDWPRTLQHLSTDTYISEGTSMLMQLLPGHHCFVCSQARV